MIPTAFRYEKPKAIDEVVGSLAQYGSDARVLAGGQSLFPLLKARAIAPKVLIDIGGVAELRGIRREGEVIRIGALTTQTELAESEDLRRTVPIFCGDASVLSDPIVRRRGTFAGALAFADPAGDWPAVALALDARVHVRGVDGIRTIPIDDFFLDSFATGLQPTDLLIHVTIPAGQGDDRTMVYRKLRHPASGFALVGVAVVLTCESDGLCRECRVAVTGAGRCAVRAKAVEDALHGQRLASGMIMQAAEHAAEGIELLSDLHAGPEYRALLVRTYAKRALLEAVPSIHPADAVSSR